MSVLKVAGMTCSHCVQAVESAVRALDGITIAKVNLAAGELYVAGDVDISEVIRLVTDAGYTVSEA